LRCSPSEDLRNFLQKGRRTYLDGPTLLLRLFHSGMAEGEGLDGVAERISINHIAERSRSRAGRMEPCALWERKI
jgi:hypothetical protein